MNSINKIFFCLLLLTTFAFSNNLNVSNIHLIGQNTSSHFTMVQFDISWDNSWRTNTFESNWDAAWVFVKWRKKTNLVWNHASLNVTGNIAPSGGSLDAPTDGRGVFLYKNSIGIGANNFTNVQLRWNYGIDGLLDKDSVEVCVFGIEMVYIPQAPFFIGDHSLITLEGQFENANTSEPFQITSEAAITLGGSGVGSLGNNNTSGMATADDFNDAVSKTLPASFPKGYNSFYIMKYELTQEQYCSFFNKLSYTQQASRMDQIPNAAVGSVVMGGTQYRNKLVITSSGINPLVPCTIGYNNNLNTVFNEANDGANVPCNYLAWADLTAYLDWSGLRPMTELEYEKACRGTNSTNAGEYAWGTPFITPLTGVVNSGQVSETPLNVTANANQLIAGFQGPIRAGAFARASTDRSGAGAGYYGVMELSGNLWERIISVGVPTARLFTGEHGNGNLNAAGNSDVINWPTNGSFRGGSWNATSTQLRLSSRQSASVTNNIRLYDYGIRGVRTAP